ncbi:MAG: hypothetical protein ACPLUL_09370 [Thermanaerothrix sp.]|jgi:hypothetical protein|uniref:Uncharacterized protein n=1 Tax=Thermanaerothrix solaris TaxID=3058434 RepID=A0ABU3NR77_9CHLR|nr:hypothetical protein [Thermanaerothrix sp. 4228-RoL]MDT8899326.1 hypothetical protein [Thermanaerothrix sp. 4228-RoL]
MGLWDFLARKPFSREHQPEVERLIEELIQIGQRDDFLAERPGGAFNAYCRHRRACEIGTRLHDLGGVPLMEYVLKRVRKRLGATLATHLSYAWADIGKWIP